MTPNAGSQQQPLGDPANSPDLGAELALRWATAADLDGLVALYGGVFSLGPDEPSDAHIQTHVGDLMSGRHPLIAPTDFALVQDTASGAVVAAACLMAQTWRYEGIALPVGRPEIVATAPEYRKQGLMRAVFGMLHARSAARGDLALGITLAEAPPLAHLVFALGRSHPLYALFGPRLDPTLRRRYAWYVRVPDLPGFVRHIAPALDRRLADSPVAGYSGALHLDLYRGGLRLALEQGRLVAVEQWRVPPRGEAQAGCPTPAFLQLLLGYRDLDALRDIYPDVWTADDTTDTVLHTLFPARPSWVQYLD